MKPDEMLIFGHTHGPFINKEKTVANACSRQWNYNQSTRTVT